MKKKRLVNCLASDAKRSFCSLHFVLAILLVMGVLVFNAYLLPHEVDTVLDWFDLFTSSFAIFLLISISAVPFSTAFCEDIEHRFIYQAVKRSGVTAYIRSKCLVIFFSAMCVMMVATWAQILYGWVRFPLVNAMTRLNIHEWEVFGFLIPDGHYALFLFLRSIQIGSLAGILSLFSAFISLFQRNRLLIYALPFFTLYLQGMIMVAFFSGTKMLPRTSLANIYLSYSDVWENQLFSMIYFVAVTFFLLAILYFCISHQVKRRIAYA